MSDAFPLPGPLKGDCQCGCGMFGTIRKSGCVKGCTCPRCRGGRNRRNGLDKQRKARRMLGVPDTKQRQILSNEEAWRHHMFRDEVKSGKQCGPVATRFLAAEAQSMASRAHGDNRPIRVTFMPEGMSDGIVCVRASVWRQHIEPMLSGPVMRVDGITGVLEP